MSSRDISVASEKFNLNNQTLLELPVLCFLMFLFTSTAILVAGLLLSLSFGSIAKTISTTTLVVIGWYTVKFVRVAPQRNGTSMSGWPAAVTLVAALLTGVLAASINRPDMDDSIYAAKPVYYMEHQDRQLDQAVTWLAGLRSEPHSIVFQYYETAQAALAWSLNSPYLAIYHVIFPFLVGTLMFLSVFLVLSLFDTRAWACLWATVLFVGVLLCLGETHRTFGNLSIARSFQGKYVFVEFGVFAWIYLSLRYLENLRKRDWGILLASGVGMVGLTTTALVFLPILSAVLWGAYSVYRRQLFSRRSIISGANYCATLIPVIIWAIVFSLDARKYIAAGSSINSGFSSNFYGQVDYLINPDYPLTPVLFAISIVITALYSPHRRFFLAWLIIPIIFFLNPIASPWVIKYVTTENIYWRLFYLLPFPLLTAIAALCLYRESPRAHLVQTLALVLLGSLALAGPTSVLRAENNSHWELLSEKTISGVLPAVQSMKERLDPGSMFAPLEISSTVVLVTSKFPQYSFREDYLGYVLENSHMDGELLNRRKVAHFLNDDPEDTDARAAAEALLASGNGPAHVVLKSATPHIDEAVALLTQLNYIERFNAGGYRAFSKGMTP